MRIPPPLKMDQHANLFPQVDSSAKEQGQASSVPHRIDIRPLPRKRIKPDGKQRYEVLYQGKVLIASTHEPLFSSCRVLLERGHTGLLEMWGPSAKTGEQMLRMSVDIERGANLTVEESDSRGPRIIKYKPYPSRADNSRSEVGGTESGAPKSISEGPGTGQTPSSLCDPNGEGGECLDANR